MPFTLAHPIVTLPLWQASQKRFDLAALMVGATIPDISYFVALQPVVNIGHSLTGVVIEGIPSGLLLLLIGRYWLWQPVRSLLPSAIATRFPIHCPYSFHPLPRLLKIILSLAIGALTHIIWDSFTHSYGWGVQRFSGLSFEIAGLPIYKALQYGCGLLGFAVLLVLLAQFVQEQTQQYRPSKLPLKQQKIAWTGVLTVAILTIGVAILAEVNNSLSAIIVRIVIGSVSGLFLGLCLYATAFWIAKYLSDQA